MNQQFVEKLVERLRDPNAKQAHGRLATADGARCCLGHACDVAMEMGLLKRAQWDDVPNGLTEAQDYALYLQILDGEGNVAWKEDALLPREVAELLMPRNALDEHWQNFQNPQLNVHGTVEGRDRASAVLLNDDLRRSLPEIADCFERTFLFGEN